MGYITFAKKKAKLATNPEGVKSLVRHFLTALASILLVLGLAEWMGVVNFIINSLDALFVAGTTISSFVTGLVGFFKNSERLQPKK